MAEKTTSSAVYSGQEIKKLPFVKKRTRGMDRNHFWTVEPSRDFNKDCQTGMAYAALALEFMKKKNLRSLLAWVVLDMPRSGETSGIEIGFLSFIAEAAMQSLSPPASILERRDPLMGKITRTLRGEQTLSKPRKQ